VPPVPGSCGRLRHVTPGHGMCRSASLRAVAFPPGLAQAAQTARRAPLYTCPVRCVPFCRGARGDRCGHQPVRNPGGYYGRTVTPDPDVFHDRLRQHATSLGRVMPPCAPHGDLTDEALWTVTCPACRVDGMPQPNRWSARTPLRKRGRPGR
jgi:hypothetical protein